MKKFNEDRGRAILYGINTFITIYAPRAIFVDGEKPYPNVSSKVTHTHTPFNILFCFISSIIIIFYFKLTNSRTWDLIETFSLLYIH